MPLSIPVSERLQNEREMGKKRCEATQIWELRCSKTNQNKRMAGYKRGAMHLPSHSSCQTSSSSRPTSKAGSYQINAISGVVCTCSCRVLVSCFPFFRMSLSSHFLRFVLPSPDLAQDV